MPTYTYDNFSKHLPVLEDVVLKQLSYLNEQKSHFLDIGSGEGAATLWMLNNLAGQTYSRVYSVDVWPQKETEKIFNRNIAESDLSYKNIKLKGNHAHQLYELFLTVQNGMAYKFNFIYANCTTQSADAMLVLLNAFNLLKDDGIMVINNYDTKHKINLLGGQAVHYREALLFFLRLYAGRVEILHEGKQLIFKKISLSTLF